MTLTALRAPASLTLPRATGPTGQDRASLDLLLQRQASPPRALWCQGRRHRVPLRLLLPATLATVILGRETLATAVQAPATPAILATLARENPATANRLSPAKTPMTARVLVPVWVPVPGPANRGEKEAARTRRCFPAGNEMASRFGFERPFRAPGCFGREAGRAARVSVRRVTRDPMARAKRAALSSRGRRCRGHKHPSVESWRHE
jgi:hypothetical protein